MKRFNFSNYLKCVSARLLSNTNQQLMTASIFPPVCRIVDVCQSCVCLRVDCVHPCIPASVPLYMRPLCVRACVCVYVHCRQFVHHTHTHLHIRENKKTKPISLCHSNTSLKLPGLFGPIKGNNTQMQARPCREL